MAVNDLTRKVSVAREDSQRKLAFFFSPFENLSMPIKISYSYSMSIFTYIRGIVSNKRKKHTPIKREQLIARKLVKDFALVSVSGIQSKPTFYSIAKSEPMAPSTITLNYLKNFQWFWSIECSVLLRDQSGSEYMASQMVDFQSRYLQSDKRVLDTLNATHNELLKGINELHFVTIGWVAMPNFEHEELEEKTLMKWYREMGGYDLPSRFESKERGSAA